MKLNSVVSKYSKALFDVTYKNGKSGEIAQEISQLTQCFKKEETSFFSNPFISQSDKLTALKSSLEGRVSVETMNFMSLLAEKNRIGLLSDIAQNYSTLVQEAAGITKGKIYAPIQLDPSYISQVESAVSKTLNKKITLVFEKDENLIAGYKVQVGSWTIDDSAQIHLKIIKDELTKRGL